MQVAELVLALVELHYVEGLLFESWREAPTLHFLSRSIFSYLFAWCTEELCDCELEKGGPNGEEGGIYFSRNQI